MNCANNSLFVFILENDCRRQCSSISLVTWNVYSCLLGTFILSSVFNICVTLVYKKNWFCRPNVTRFIYIKVRGMWSPVFGENLH